MRTPQGLDATPPPVRPQVMAPRRVWLDWQRGLAVLFMIEVHILTGWTVPDGPRGPLFHFLHMLGGLAAPGFLYMAGLSTALVDDALARRGLSASARRRDLVKRALYVWGVAYTFRVVEYVLGGAFRVEDGWRGLLRVDILNVIGASLLICGLLASLRWRRAWALGAGLIVTASTPLVAALPERFRVTDYLYPVEGTGFSLCPWAAFAFFGFIMGTYVVRGVRPGRIVLVAALTAWLAFVVTKVAVPYGVWSYWHTSPMWVLWRLAITLGLSGALMLLAGRVTLAPLALLGRHSLMVYMVSVELTYGLSLRVLHGALGLEQAILGMVAMTLGCLALCALVERRARLRADPAARVTPAEAPP